MSSGLSLKDFVTIKDHLVVSTRPVKVNDDSIGDQVVSALQDAGNREVLVSTFLPFVDRIGSLTYLTFIAGKYLNHLCLCDKNLDRSIVIPKNPGQESECWI